MNSSFTALGLAQVIPNLSQDLPDFDVTADIGAGRDIWGYPVPPPPQRSPSTENRPPDPDELTEQRTRHPLQWSVPRGNQNTNILEAQVRVPGQDTSSNFWSEGDGWPHWTDLEFDLVEPELSEYDSTFDDATVGSEPASTEAEHALRRAHERAQDLHTELVLDTDHALLDSTSAFAAFRDDRALQHARERAEDLCAELERGDVDVDVDDNSNVDDDVNDNRDEELARDIALSWFRKHGRTVQAPALNIEQILALGTSRRERVTDRVVAFFRILELVQSWPQGARDSDSGVTLKRKDAWMSELDDAQEDESVDSILEHMWPGHNGNNGNDSVFVDDYGSFSESSESSESSGPGSTPPSSLSSASESPADLDRFHLQHFLDTITPDERIVFRYFLDHPETTRPESLRIYRELHEGNSQERNQGTGHFCMAGGDWHACYLEELLCLYAKHEQAAVNEFVGGLGPADNQNLDDEFLLADEDFEADDEHVEDDDEQRFRRVPLPNQWRTHDTEGSQSWMLYLKPYFAQGYVPQLGTVEWEAWEQAQNAARFAAARPPLRKMR